MNKAAKNRVIPSFTYCQISCEEVGRKLGVDPEQGLGSQEVRKRLASYGVNQIVTESITWWQIFLRQFSSPFFYLLLLAAATAFFLGEVLDAGLILGFILINTTLGFYQEFRSDRSLKLLKKYIAIRDTVRRDGELTKVETDQLVPGDAIFLLPGDIVPADIRVCQAEGLIVDESILTGESTPVSKTCDSLSAGITAFHKAKNMVFAGTTIVSGSGAGIVVTTGSRSAIGHIALITKETSKESEFAKGIGSFSKFILRLVVLTIGFVFLANLALKREEARGGEFLVFSIALTVSVIPEALPVVSIFSLSRGALHLAKRKVVVKRLSSVEDIGGIDILCTDKTGTITEGRMTLSESSATQSQELLLGYAYLAGSPEKHTRVIEPFDKALEKALSQEARQALKHYRRLRDVPFDPVRRRNAVLVQNRGALEMIVRGAPEEILKCTLPDNRRGQHQKWVSSEGKQGRRVLAVAFKKLRGEPQELSEEEHDLNLLGFISFEDPIKKTAFGAVKKAQSLGITIKILTGDAPEVAGAVARQIGLVADETAVLTGAAFEGLPAAKQREAAHRFQVFARISPEQKHQIISLLQESHAVGYLGEGINDAPALKAASVSLVVESASDIAREVADIVLLQKSLHVIVDGIQEGRAIFSNTLKYIRATLASNFGNFYAVAIGSLFVDFLPMLPVQILLVNLLSDFPMITIAADRVDREDTRKPQEYRIRDIALLATFLGVVSSIFDFLIFALYFRSSPAVLQTNWFIFSIITELVFLYSVRTRKFVFSGGRPAFVVILLSSLAFLATVLLPYTQLGQTVFHFQAPGMRHLVTILSLTAMYFVASEVVKLLYYRFVPSGK